MRCGGADLGGCQCSDGLSGGYGAAACPAAGLESAGSAQWCFNEAPLVAPADRRSATPRTRRMAGRGQAAAIRPQNPRRTSAAPCPRYTPRPRALAAAEGQLEGARAQLVHADHVSKGHRQALSIHLAWACRGNVRLVTHTLPFFSTLCLKLTRSVRPPKIGVSNEIL